MSKSTSAGRDGPAAPVTTRSRCLFARRLSAAQLLVQCIVVSTSAFHRVVCRRAPSKRAVWLDPGHPAAVVPEPCRRYGALWRDAFRSSHSPPYPRHSCSPAKLGFQVPVPPSGSRGVPLSRPLAVFGVGRVFFVGGEGPGPVPTIMAVWITAGGPTADPSVTDSARELGCPLTSDGLGLGRHSWNLHNQVTGAGPPARGGPPRKMEIDQIAGPPPPVAGGLDLQNNSQGRASPVQAAGGSPQNQCTTELLRALVSRTPGGVKSMLEPVAASAACACAPCLLTRLPCS
jgi:hypothetical protein